MWLLRLASLQMVFGVGLLAGCTGRSSSVPSSSPVDEIPMIAVAVDPPKAEPTPTVYSPMETCKTFASLNDRALCESVVRDLKIDEPVFALRFEYGQRLVDLNGDKRPEVVVWVRSIGGSSGYPLLIYEKRGDAFDLLYEGLAWSPIIAVPADSTGWMRIGFLRQGGGVEPHFVILRYSSSLYGEQGTSSKEPRGEVIYPKDWQATFYGPIRPRAD